MTEASALPQWNYDREVGWHTLAVPGQEDAFMFVYRTAGGDYAISAMREGDAGGGHVEYRPSLLQAKKYAEKIRADGSWRDFTESCDPEISDRYISSSKIHVPSRAI